MATLTGVGVSANPGAKAGAVSTTTWNTRDTGGGATNSPGLGGGPMTGATANGVRLAVLGINVCPRSNLSCNQL